MTPKQQRFVEEYLVDLNATQAAIRAGYSADTAYSIGNENLSKPEIAEAITAAKAERSKQTGIDAAWLLTRLADEADADLSDLYDEAGALKPVKDWPLIWRKGLVGGVKAIEERDENGDIIGMIREVKLSDRVKRLELIGKHIDVQAFREQVAQTGTMALVVSNEDAGL
ncbi:MAG: terminase small subunit [Candidatus Sphingomonas colombiensis]|nr:terminase small subunit [Sphingomonas sp.]WEK42966.1 MAG: terminase small subunit [Sphingomonas sp.]